MNELTPEQQVINDTRPITDVNLLLEAQKMNCIFSTKTTKNFMKFPKATLSMF